MAQVLGKPVVTIPGCPPNPYNFLATVVHLLAFGNLPAVGETIRVAVVVRHLHFVLHDADDGSPAVDVRPQALRADHHIPAILAPPPKLELGDRQFAL